MFFKYSDFLIIMKKEEHNKPTITSTSPHRERECMCGCETMFIPRRRDQVYLSSNHANHAYNHGKRKQKSKRQIEAEKQLRLNDRLLAKFYNYFKENEVAVLSLNLKAEGFDHSFFIGTSLIGKDLYYKSFNYLFKEYIKDGIKITKILIIKNKVYVKRRRTN